jgi:opacity protein-like surface antigen
MRVKVILTAAAAAAFLAAPAAADLASCKMAFNLSGWSFVYKRMTGQGKITCSNGQRADVKIESNGGGFTIGKSDILNGEGTFSEVKDISEIFGTYAQAEAHGAATKGGAAQVMSKGEISLAIAGGGRGWDVGVSFGGFTIERK